MTAAPGPRSSRPRSEANYGPQRGTTYLIHIDPPYKHAKHYKGWTDRPVGLRFADHLAGRGALLTRLAVQAGSRLTLARVWPDTTRDREDSIKRHGGKRMCPECGVTPGHTRLASDKPPEPDDRRPRWQYERDGEWADDGTPIIYDPSQTNAQARAEAAHHPVVLSAEDREELAALDDLQRQWSSQEEQVGLRNAVARAASAVRAGREAHQRRAANREADRLSAIADQLERQTGGRPNYKRELLAERAERIRVLLGEDLTADARAHATPEQVAAWEEWARQEAERSSARAEAQRGEEVSRPGGGPELQGAERDAEIDRLAAQFGEPESLFGPRPDGTYAGVIDGDAAARAGAGPRPDLSPDEMQAFEQAERARWAQADRDTEYMARQAARYYGPQMADLLGIEPVDAVQAPDDPAAVWERGEDAATWNPLLGADCEPSATAQDRLLGELDEHAAWADAARRQEARDLGRHHMAQEAPHRAAINPEYGPYAESDILRGAGQRRAAAEMRENRRRAEANAYRTAAALQDVVARDAAGEAEPEPMERMSPEAANSPEVTPVAATQQPGTAHADPALGERGWQADDHGVYVRNSDAEASGPHRELAGYEAGSPDHQYGSPQCAEADPEGAHFGQLPGEPQDTGRWPVLQADYGRMYIPPYEPQAQAEAV
jgi:hypothetical protein